MFYDDTPIAKLLDATSGKPKLLVVDDKPVNIQVLHQIFAADYQVFMATSGAQALAICRSNPPDLILLDVVMPEMDGFEVCTELKSDAATRDIPIIFVTAHDDTSQETHGLDVGAVDFIAKPVNPAVVRARVKTHLMLKLQSDVMRKLVFLDGLTGVFNRRYFDQQIAIEWARAARNDAPLSVILIDVDFFKDFNDQYGHQAGDDCLQQIARTLKASLKRPADLVARYGGEEFVCILPDTGFDDAMLIARGLEQQVRATEIAHAKSTISAFVTISLGVAARSHLLANSPTEDGTIDSSVLVALADARLYLAKSNGRGQACGD
jgi:diguanylate cyclase (GGDEF)-like protein